MNAQTKFVAQFLANDEMAHDQAQRMIAESAGGYEAAERLKSFYAASTATVSTGARNSSVLFTRLLRETLAAVDWLRVVDYLLD